MVDLGPPLRHACLHLRRVVRALVPKPLGVAGQRVGEIAQGLRGNRPTGRRVGRAVRPNSSATMSR